MTGGAFASIPLHCLSYLSYSSYSPYFDHARSVAGVSRQRCLSSLSSLSSLFFLGNHRPACAPIALKRGRKKTHVHPITVRRSTSVQREPVAGERASAFAKATA